MNYNIDARLRTARARLAAAAMVFLCAAGAAGEARAQNTPPPPTPTAITPPAGNSFFLLGRATGTQGYACLPTSPGAATASWTINPARPEATLFQRFLGYDVQVVTHFLSPNTNPKDDAPRPIPFGNATWQSSFDSSKVWAAVLHSNVVPASSDIESCPNTGSIPCLLLETVGSQAGPSGGTILSKTTFIQRLNTNGGAAPAEGCSTAADVGKQALVPYTADYYFYRKDR